MPAHSNRSDDGKGGAQKADDCFVAIACQRCHDLLDGRDKLRKPDGVCGLMVQEDIEWYHDRAIKRTIRRLLDLGVIK